MTEIDMLLRDTLHDHAEEAPGANGLLSRVHHRSRRMRVRRRAGAAGAGLAAVVLATGGTAVVIDAAGFPRSSDAGGYAAPRASTTPGQAAPGQAGPNLQTPGASPEPADPQYPATTVTLSPANVNIPSFPLVPPVGVIADLGPAEVRLETTAVLLHKNPLIQIGLSASRPAPTDMKRSPLPERPVRLRGVAGAAAEETMGDKTFRYLWWQEPVHGWMVVRAAGVAEADLIRYVDGLRPGTVRIDPPMTFDSLPTGFIVDHVSSSAMVFRPANVPAGHDFIGKLAVFYNTGNDVPESASWPLRVDGRPAKITSTADGDGDGTRTLVVALGEGRDLTFQVPPNIVISDADLLTLAGGARLTATASPGQG